jgi:nucleotide-binding universal stress UspA family protein
MLRKLLIGIDGSGPSRAAIDAGVALAAQLNATVALLHVVDVAAAFGADPAVPDEDALAQLRAFGKKLMEATLERVRKTLEPERAVVVEGDPAETLISLARDWRADAIVIGSDSRGRLAQFLLGTTADAVIRRAPCPVLTVRQQPEQLIGNGDGARSERPAVPVTVRQ